MPGSIILSDDVGQLLLEIIKYYIQNAFHITQESTGEPVTKLVQAQELTRTIGSQLPKCIMHFHPAVVGRFASRVPSSEREEGFSIANIEMSSPEVRALIEALDTAIQYEKEAVASGEPDMKRVAKFNDMKHNLRMRVTMSLRKQHAAKMKAMGVSE
jgi:hypothetical protein